MREYDEEREWEAQQEADGEAYYDHLYKQIGPEWARDHASELLEEHYEDAVNQFTLERLQSYYSAQPNLAVPARDSLLYAQSLMPSFPQAALVFAVTATELTVKTVLLKPLISGLVHTEDLASFIAELTTKHTGMDRFQKLLTEIVAQFGGVQLKTFKRAGSVKTLWEEIGEIQCARNAVSHRGETVDSGIAVIAISVSTTLLNEVFPQILKKLGLHLHDPITVCGVSHPNSTR